MKNAIPLVCTIDDKYVQHCAVMLASLFSYNKDLNFEIHVITNGLETENKFKLYKFIEKRKAKAYFYQVDEQVLKNAPITHHVSLATYYRILIPNILPQTLAKVLFLDCDIIIQNSIKTLWDIDIENYFLAACCEYPSLVRKAKLGLKPESSYFNAGVMLINLNKWRQENILEQALNIINNHSEKIDYWDQDILNIIFENHWLSIPQHWNVNEKYYVKPYTYEDFKISEKDYHNCLNHPNIIHFTGSSKPWETNNTHPKKDIYFIYLTKTPWRKQNKSYLTAFKILNKIKAKLKQNMFLTLNS